MKFADESPWPDPMTLEEGVFAPEESEMGTQIVEIREALRQAIDEEMTRDHRVFIMGEEVAEYNGAYKVTKGMLAQMGS